MSAAYGVHFGCTAACIAVTKDEKTDVIANDLGDRTTPCVVAFTDHDQAVGAAAKQGMIRNIQNTVCHVKQVLGRRCDHPAVTEYKRQSAVSVIDRNGDPVFEVDYKEARRIFTPREIAALIYKKMLETAQSHGGSGIQDSVFAVPLYFTQEQRNALSAVATEAGFNVMRLISEPAAAVLAYDIGQTDNTQNSRVLVFRLGGMSSDAAVVDVQGGMYKISGCVTDTSFGGDQFTEALVKYLVTEFKRQSRLDVSDNKRSIAKLRRAAEICKHTMSKLNDVQCAVDSLYEGMDFNTKVSRIVADTLIYGTPEANRVDPDETAPTGAVSSGSTMFANTSNPVTMRARFESCINELVQKCGQLIDKVLAECSIGRGDIDKVILCGGGTNVPMVQKAVTDLFPNSEILNSINPEEVIALGAAKQAGILTNLEDEDIKLHTQDTQIDSIAHAVCVQVSSDDGPVYKPVFPSRAPLHSRKHLDFTLGETQTAFVLPLYEVDKPIEPSHVQLLAKIVMKDLTPAATINTTFHLRRDGHLHVTCSEAGGSRSEAVTVEPR